MSQDDGESKEIDGVVFKVTMLDPLAANDLLVDLGATIGPALGTIGSALLRSPDTSGALKELMDGVSGDDQGNGDIGSMVGPLIGEGLESAILGLVDRIEKHKIREFITVLSRVSSVRRGDKWVGLEGVSTIIFRGKLKLMYQWLGFAIKVQFSDFFTSQNGGT